MCKRCNWKNLDTSQVYKNYHDNEWGIPSYNDEYLFEMFILESFHCGLSWLLILNKRNNFKQAYDNFSVDKVAKYDTNKIEELLNNSGIVRNKAKILASITNAQAFIKVREEFGSFSKYIWSFTNNKIEYYPYDGVTSSNKLSNLVSKDLKKRGFKFMGTVTTFSYLEAIGVMNNHSNECFKNAIMEEKNGNTNKN